MTPIQTKLQQLQAGGLQVGLLPPVEVPDAKGGSFMLIPPAFMTLIQAPGASVAWAVHGDILGAYTAQGGVFGSLGYPKSDEFAWCGTKTRANLFENGLITWAPVVGANVKAGKLATNIGQAALNAATLLAMPTEAARAKIHHEEGLTYPPPLKDATEWCGYTLANLFKAASMDPTLTGLFAGVQGLLNYGSYYTRTQFGVLTAPQMVTKVLPEGTDVRAVHTTRNMLRTVTFWHELRDPAKPPQIWPGDIVLLDRSSSVKPTKGAPDHIQIAINWHPENRMLTVIDGNGLGFVLRSVLEKQFGTRNLISGIHFKPLSDVPVDGARVSQVEKQRLLRQYEDLDVLLPNAGGGRVSISCHLLTEAGQSDPPTPDSDKYHDRVFAVIRPSLMDFERHRYTTVPVPVPRPIPHK